MDRQTLLNTLTAVSRGEMSPEAALGLLNRAPFEDLGYARIDHHRQQRSGSAEVIYGAGKTAEQISGIASRMIDACNGNILITRMDAEKAEVVGRTLPLFYDPVSRVGIANRQEQTLVGRVVWPPLAPATWPCARKPR